MDIKDENPRLIDIKEPPLVNYLLEPTIDLMSSFGQGNHIPGSGSAAALTGLIAVELMRTVATISLEKEAESINRRRFEYVLEVVENAAPKYIEFFNTDVQTFHKVSYHRRLRDRATKGSEEREINKQAALSYLRAATDIPIDVCDLSLSLVENAYTLFDYGYKAVRGDSGVAISNLLASAQGALFITFLNLKSFSDSNWKDGKMNKAIEQSRLFTRLQRLGTRRVSLLMEESVNPEQLTINFGPPLSV